MKHIIKNYIPLTVPDSIEFEKVNENENNMFKLKVNGDEVTVVSEYLGGTKSEPEIVHLSKNMCKHVEEEFASQDKPYPYIVENFEYNGFCGKSTGGFANYRATFVNWTGDPGIARMLCSDGEVRLIPTFALKGRGFSLPYDDTENKIMFGQQSAS